MSGTFVVMLEKFKYTNANKSHINPIDENIMRNFWNCFCETNPKILGIIW